MAEPITSAVSNRICKHMNKDHADAVLFYATTYGNLPSATAATLDTIDAEGMTLIATVADQPQAVRIAFDHTLSGAEDAHHTLVAMLKARSATA